MLRGEVDVPREALSEVRWHEGQDMRALRAGKWKYIEERGPDTRDLLFDLGTDPKEMEDLVGRETARVKSLADLVGKRLIRALRWAERFPMPERYEPGPGDRERLEQMGYTGKDG